MSWKFRFDSWSKRRTAVWRMIYKPQDNKPHIAICYRFQSLDVGRYSSISEGACVELGSPYLSIPSCQIYCISQLFWSDWFRRNYYLLSTILDILKRIGNRKLRSVIRLIDQFSDRCTPLQLSESNSPLLAFQFIPPTNVVFMDEVVSLLLLETMEC